MPSRTKLALGAALLVLAPPTVAQSNLGELMDAGGRVLSAEEFRQELVQRVVVGPTATGGTLDLVYLGNGMIQGVGWSPGETLGLQSSQSQLNINGEWKIDDSGRICVSMVIGKTVLPFRCQFWFKQGNDYFLSDSDSDRRARVLRRTVKQ